MQIFAKDKNQFRFIVSAVGLPLFAIILIYFWHTTC